MRKGLLVIFLFVFAALAGGQNFHTRDSLYSILHNTNDDSVKKKALGALYLYYYPVNRDSSNYFGTRIIELGKATNDIKLLYAVYAYLGGQNRTAGNYLAALDWNNRMLDLAVENKDSVTAATALNSIGNLYKDQGLYRKSIPHYAESKKLSESRADSTSARTLVYANMNMGYVYLQLNKIDSALVYEQNAYALALKINDTESLQYILYCLGNIQLKLNNNTLALEYYKTGLRIVKDETRYSCMIYNALAKYYINQGIGNDVIYARKALGVANKISNVKLMAESAKMLSDVYESKNRFDSAYYYQDMFISLNDSLNNRERIAEFENLMFKEVLHQQEKKEAMERAQEKRSYNIQLVILTLAILSILMLFLLISRSIIVSHKLVAFLSIVVLLVLFEFINLVLHPILEHLTNDQPILMLLAMVGIAALIVPLHQRHEKWTSNKLVEKNKAIRLANAKRVIEELEREADTLKE
jgi:hypothetical protein